MFGERRRPDVRRHATWPQSWIQRENWEFETHREDIAESILPYFAVRYRTERLTEADRSAILAAIPNRLVYFDEQGFDMSPYTRGSTTRILGLRPFQPRRIWQPFEGPPIR